MDAETRRNQTLKRFGMYDEKAASGVPVETCGLLRHCQLPICPGCGQVYIIPPYPGTDVCSLCSLRAAKAQNKEEEDV